MRKEAARAKHTLEAIRLAETIHEHVRELHSCRREELRERVQLEAQHTTLSEQVASLQSEVASLKADLRKSREELEQRECQMVHIENDRNVLRDHITNLTKVISLLHTRLRRTLLRE